MCSLVIVSTGRVVRWVIGSSSCWTVVCSECWWISLGMSRSYNVEGCELCDVGGGLYPQSVCVRLWRSIYMEMGYVQERYLQERYLQMVYLQYGQVCYVCQREQFQQWAFQSIEVPWGVLTLVR